MKQSDGVTKPGPTAVTILATIASFALLALATRSLPLGTADAIWTRVGALCVGIVFLGEAAAPGRILSAALILAGLIGLKLSSKGRVRGWTTTQAGLVTAASFRT